MRVRVRVKENNCEWEQNRETERENEKECEWERERKAILHHFVHHYLEKYKHVDGFWMMDKKCEWVFTYKTRRNLRQPGLVGHFFPTLFVTLVFLFSIEETT